MQVLRPRTGCLTSARRMSQRLWKPRVVSAHRSAKTPPIFQRSGHLQSSPILKAPCSQSTPSGSPEAAGSASPAEGNFSWHELATTDDQAGLSFYIELFGWKPGARHDMGELGYYQLINHGGKDIGGIYNLQPGV